jgi:hypothetical protein
MYGCNLYLGTGKEAWHIGASMYEPATPTSRTPEDLAENNELRALGKAGTDGR